MQKEKHLFPQLRFPEFEGEWQLKKLGDVGKVKMCKRVFNNETSEFGEIPFYKIGTFGKVADAYITNELYLNYKNKFSFPKVGDILISAAGTLGRTVVYDGSPAYYQDSNIVWLDNNENLILNDFLYYIYQIVRYDSEGGTIQRLYNSIILKTKFYKPSKEEQQKIANFLVAIGNHLQSLEKKKNLLEQYKKGVMQQIFKQEIRFKKDDGEDFPQWEVKRIGRVFKERNEKDFPEMELLSISINLGIYPQSESNKKDSSNSNKSKYKRVLKDDIAYNSMRMWQGASSVSEYNGIVSPAYTILEGNESNDSRFFGYLFKMSFMIQTFQKHSQGLTSDTWNLKYPMISKIKVDVPCFEEQTKIANFLSTIDKKIELVNEQIEKTKTYKKGLLQQMFV